MKSSTSNSKTINAQINNIEDIVLEFNSPKLKRDVFKSRVEYKKGKTKDLKDVMHSTQL